MQLIHRRTTPYTEQNPYRPIRPTTSKIIFLSCEGSVTEEEYIEVLSRIYDGVKGRVQVISVAEDEVHTEDEKAESSIRKNKTMAISGTNQQI